MIRSVLSKLLLAGFVGAAVLTMTAQESKAGWYHWGCYGWGCSPYVAVYRPVCYRPVCYRPVVYQSYCASPACACCSTCRLGCYRSCLPRYRCLSYCNPCYTTAYSTIGCCGSTVVPSAGVIQKSSPAPSVGTPTPADADPVDPPALPGPATTRSSRPSGSTTLAVDVPEDARVYVNGVLTKTPGTHRQYVSRGLTPGYRYTYEVRVEVTRDGQTLTDTKTVNVRAGQTTDLAFDLQAAPAVVPTMLTLNVPEDAKVTLEGHATAAKGTNRQFTTTALTKGAEWKDYEVVVELNRNGQTETRRETITLVGGESQQLNFSFGSDQLALR